jgi:D-inositol-3-phosphate glycosyltransferase
MRRLLLAGLWGAASGLGRVLNRLAAELDEDYLVSVLGFEPQPAWSARSFDIEGRRVHLRRGPLRHFAADRDWLHEEMSRHPPDVVLVVGPAFLARPLLVQLQSWRASTLIALYMPMEGRATGDALVSYLTLVDLCLLYTQTALHDVGALCEARAGIDPGFKLPALAVIGHGVDHALFHPLPGTEDAERRAAARRSVFADRPELHDAFIVLNANRPYRRKRLDLSIAGFAAFAAARNDVRLVLHTGPRSQAQEDALRALAVASGAGDKVVFSPREAGGALPDDAALNALYNACDVGLSTAMGEGWGLTAFEHALTRAPQIVPDHTHFAENWRGAARLLPCSGSETVFYECAEMFSTSAAEVAAALTELHADAALRGRLGAAAHARATEERFCWPAVGRRLRERLGTAQR